MSTTQGSAPWVRHLAKGLAAEGRTVFLSSHLMSEMAQTADHLIIIGRGRIIADAPMDDIIAGQGQVRSRVRADKPQCLANAIAGDGISVDILEPDLLQITGLDPWHIAQAARNSDVLIYELVPLQASLEDAYMRLTRDEVEYHSADPVTQMTQQPDTGEERGPS